MGLSLFHDLPCKTKTRPDVDLDRFQGLSIDSCFKEAQAKPTSHSGTTSGTTTDEHTENSTPLTASGFPPFFNMSAQFSSLVVSALLQNPAAYATAMLAASFWPAADVETSAVAASERSIKPTPTIEAIACATVAAASAWWATHGLLPYWAPAGLFPGVFPFVQSLRVEEAVLRSKSMPSSSDSDELNPEKEATICEPDDPDREKKKADRSSCGSNTPSSSDVETNVAEDLEIDLHLGPAHSPSRKEVSHQVSDLRSCPTPKLFIYLYFSRVCKNPLCIEGPQSVPSAVLERGAAAELLASQGRRKQGEAAANRVQAL